MAGVRTLTIAEVRMIKALLALPSFTKQRVLAYFTKPDRDLNHRLITEIADGQHWPSEPPATPAEAQAFIAASLHHQHLSADDFVDMSPVGAPRERRHLLLLDWWAAGQGLFASGMISRRNGSPLVWVYDCGSTSSKAILVQSRKSFERQYNAIGGAAIQLAALSHFDTDHLSGLVDLLGFARIQTLLLPYVPAWRRLVFAVEQGVDPTTPEFGFFLNPAAYIAAVADGRIERIVFVPPSLSDELPSDTPDEPLFPVPEVGRPEEGTWKDLKIDKGPIPQDAARDVDLPPQAKIDVTFLRPGGRLEAPGLWEFVPYNDAEMAPRITAADVAAIEVLRDKLLRSPATRKKTLAALKTYFDRIFTTSEERNLISLFLYSGPVGSRYRLQLCRLCRRDWPKQLRKFSQMHTGDGYLNNEARLRAFESYFGHADRLGRSALLQVMHHGSSANWHAGVAARLNPKWSIFSSDPSHKKFGHPHAAVLRDFWMHGPVQVDRDRGFHMHGWLER